MIGFFPEAYEDELLYSQLCRYYQRTGYTRYVFAVDDLFMRRTVHPVIEWVNEYTPDALSHITKGSDFETVIREHTMFPAYTRFLPKERRNAAFHSLLICDGNYYNLVIGQNPGHMRYLRYCPLCAQDDRTQLGETYWHREHQLLHIDVCTKHGCFLTDSTIPISSTTTPGLFPAEIEVPIDAVPAMCQNDRLVAFNQYVLDVFRAPVDMESDMPIGSFLRSKLDSRYMNSSRMRVNTTKLYDDYCSFFQGLCDPMSFENFRKVYSSYALDHYQICQIAYFQNIPAEELTRCHMDTTSTAMQELYHSLACELSISFETVSKIGDAIIAQYRRLGRVSRKSGPKQREWAMLDEEYLPRVRKIVDDICSSEGRPSRVSVKRIEKEIGAPQKQFQKLPKCMKYITEHIETRGEYRARQVTWAVRLFEKEGRYISANNMLHPVMFCFGRGFLHFTCNYLPLSAKQMTKDIYPIILLSSKLMCTQQERGSLMQVKIEVSPEHTPPRAVIYTDRITPEIQRALDILQAKNTPVLAERDGRTFLLAEQEVYMIRVEGGETRLYTKKEEFRTRKRLYEVLDQLGSGFIQISKSCAVNLSYAESVEAGFGGSLLLKMKNGLSDYVSRKYLSDLKNYLGL